MPARKPWFAPKRFGYGSGLPITWEGWVALIGYLVSVIFVAPLLPLVPSFAFIGVATGAMVWLCATRTAGGWRWRNGKD